MTRFLSGFPAQPLTETTKYALHLAHSKRNDCKSIGTTVWGCRIILAAAAAALALGGILTAATAVAEPRCNYEGDWDCEGPQQYNGPLQNTWSHGLTTMPQLCPGAASMQPCQFYVPQP